MTTFLFVVVALMVGGVAGMTWGRALEQKAIAKVVGEFRLVDTASRDAINRLEVRLPFLKKLHL